MTKFLLIAGMVLTEPTLPEHWAVSGMFDVAVVATEVDPVNLPRAIPSWDVAVRTPTSTEQLTPLNSTLSYRDTSGANLVISDGAISFPASGVTSHDILQLEGQGRIVFWLGSGALEQGAVAVIDLSAFDGVESVDRIGPDKGYVVAKIPEPRTLVLIGLITLVWVSHKLTLGRQ